MPAHRLDPQRRPAKSGLYSMLESMLTVSVQDQGMHRIQCSLVRAHEVLHWIQRRYRGITTGVALAGGASQRVPSSRGVTCTATGCHLHSPLCYLDQRKGRSGKIPDKGLCVAWQGGLHRAGARGAAREALGRPHSSVPLYHQDLLSGTSVPHRIKGALNRRESHVLQSLVAFP
jgi:hypothetical protein